VAVFEGGFSVAKGGGGRMLCIGLIEKTMARSKNPSIPPAHLKFAAK